METWHSTWLKSKTRPLSGASEYMEYGTTAKSGNWNTRFDKMWDFSLRKIRRTDAVFLAVLRSQRFSADKGNQKPGLAERE